MSGSHFTIFHKPLLGIDNYWDYLDFLRNPVNSPAAVDFPLWENKPNHRLSNSRFTQRVGAIADPCRPQYPNHPQLHFIGTWLAPDGAWPATVPQSTTAGVHLWTRGCENQLMPYDLKWFKLVLFTWYVLSPKNIQTFVLHRLNLPCFMISYDSSISKNHQTWGWNLWCNIIEVQET